MPIVKPASPLPICKGPLAQNTLLFLPMWEGSGLTCNDHSGQGNTGTLNGGASWVGGQSGWCLNFVLASSQYLDCGRVKSIEGISQLTMAFWAKRAAAGKRVEFSKNDGSFTNCICIEVYSDGVVYFEPSLGATGYGTFSQSDANWHHYAMVFDGTQAGNANRLKGYLDGAQQTLSYTGAVGTTTSSLATGNLTLGRFFTTYSDGQADSPLILNRALTAPEVALLYADQWASVRRRRMAWLQAAALTDYFPAWAPMPWSFETEYEEILY